MSTLFSRPSFIVFEGLDGAGKTTCAGHMASAMGVHYMTTPSPTVRKYRDELLASFGPCEEAAQLFYLATVFDASRRVNASLAAGMSVVMDRYFLSTQVYALFRGSKIGCDALQVQLVPADITVFLDVPLAVREARLGMRRCSGADGITGCHSGHD
jgi:thymidylate kinase